MHTYCSNFLLHVYAVNKTSYHITSGIRLFLKEKRSECRSECRSEARLLHVTDVENELHKMKILQLTTVLCFTFSEEFHVVYNLTMTIGEKLGQINYIA